MMRALTHPNVSHKVGYGEDSDRVKLFGGFLTYIIDGLDLFLIDLPQSFTKRLVNTGRVCLVFAPPLWKRRYNCICRAHRQFP